MDAGDALYPWEKKGNTLADSIEISRMAERAEEIDVARAEQARDRAAARLAKIGDYTVDFVRAQEALMRALTRLEVAAKKR